MLFAWGLSFLSQAKEVEEAEGAQGSHSIRRQEN